MANRLKTKTPPPPNPEVLTADKEVDVTVTEVVKDERTTKIAGTVCLLLALFLFIAFTSYVFTWQEDQDTVHQFGVKIFSTNDVKVNNLLGVLGAYTAHFFIYKGFGIAAYLFCSFFFVLGINLLFGKKIFSLLRNSRYVLVGLLVISVAAAFASMNTEFSYGGAVGELVNNWLIKWIGKVGTGCLLAITVFSYFIWRFNPSFTWPNFKWPAKENAVTTTTDDTLLDTPAKATINELYANEEIEEEIPPLETKQNKLKEGGQTAALAATTEEAPTANFDVVEKEINAEDEAGKLFIDDTVTAIEPPIVETAAITTTENVTVIMPDMPLEIKEGVEEEPRVEPTAKKPLKIEFDDEIDIELELQDAVDDTLLDEDDMVEPAIGSLDTEYDATLELRDYKFPSVEILEQHGSEKIIHDPTELEANKNQIIATLKNYDIAIQRIAATVGPTVTLYEIVPAPGVRISRIKNLEDDIALSLAALGIRIIAPIPGKGTIGIEVPNIKKTVVSMKTLLQSDKFINTNYSLPIAIGKKIDNENFIVDLATMPHLLMAGATGQGKSVGINTLLVSLLYKKHPSQLKFVLVDPKKVELSLYRVIEKHFLAKLPGEEESIITDTKKVVHTLNALCIEMDNRYDLLKEAGCRNIREYNDKFTARKLNPQKGHQYLPFIVLVVDEFADLIMTAGKEVEMPIARLAQLARAIGIHLIIATQRPSVNIITGTIKANFPARIAFKVSSKIDSRTILDAGGAEQLIGKGDMLISYGGEITRVQCAFVDTPEVENVCEFIGDQRGYPQAFLLPEYVDEKEESSKGFDPSEKDSLFEDAARLIVQNQMGSTSLIQRRMKLGYNRAGRLMDQLEAAGIVGANQGSKAREVLFKTMEELEEYLRNMGG
jgi:DNA segregation ATPase FtsK/SpoIIIE, S-DNA-T family